MTFWLEKEWQTRAALRICGALDGVNEKLLPQRLKDGEWTKPMLTDLAPAALELCGEHAPRAACSFGGGEPAGHRKGWLYDFCCFVTDEAERLVGLPIVIESEWLSWSQVLDDFEKLLQARAGLRVLIFQHDRTAPSDWREDLFARTRLFAECSAADAWLFAYWKDNRFEYVSNVIE